MSCFYTMIALSFLTGGTVGKNCTVIEQTTIKCNYFPDNISEAISRVAIVDFIDPKDYIEINSSVFDAEGWKHVKYLDISNSRSYENAVNITAETFSSMKMLNELGIHLSHVNFDSDIFVSLNSVETLNVSDCFRLGLNNFLQTLNGTDKLRELKRLIMSRFNEYHPPNIIDERFGLILQQKKLTYLDMSNMQLTEVHLDIFKNLKYLKHLNISGAVIGDTKDKYNFNISDLKNVDLDISHAILPQKLRPPPGKIVISNQMLNISSWKSFFCTYFAQTNTYNGSSIMSQLTNIWIKNFTLIFDKPLIILLRRLVLKENNIKWLDINFVCTYPCIASDLEEINLSRNGMQFVNSIGRRFAPNLKIINMSSNQLYKMAKTNNTLFEILFYSLWKLRVISLSMNGLTTIPVNLFRDNFALKVIDLSGNELEQVTFSLSHLSKLELLDLQSNYIHILNQESLILLNSIPQKRKHNNTMEIMLSHNPISCSKCEAKDFLQWLLTSYLVEAHLKNLKCSYQDGHKSSINDHALKRVQTICDRFKLIMIACASGVVAIGMIILVIVLTYRCCRRCLKLNKRRRNVQLMKNGVNHYEFAVFLAYSSDDDNFVDENIFVELNEHLQNITELERELVCIEDQFTPGASIVHEIFRCFQRVSVIVAVLSGNFFRNQLCHFKLELACRTGKPIVLMLKERVDERILTDFMRYIYRTNTKILWTFENGEYILQDKWDNVATCILDLIE